MPNVFISYAREDLAVVQPLEQALIACGIGVWRDQESLYGGQQWPKAIGDAISAHDVLLLAWSKHAAASHFVEFEWTTAIALRKTILPCLLDETPLPSALSAINGIEMRALEAALPKILQAVQRPVATTDPEHRAEVLERLQEIGSGGPSEVVDAAKTVFRQHGWGVQGNVYQAARDMHLIVERPAAKAQKTLLEKWQTWVALFVGLLTVATLSLGLWEKLVKMVMPGQSYEQAVQTLSGVIWDENGETLGGVEVTLPEFTRKVITESDGRFSFQVKAPQQQHVRLIARKDGYRTYYGDPTLGYSSMEFNMRREK